MTRDAVKILKMRVESDPILKKAYIKEKVRDIFRQYSAHMRDGMQSDERLRMRNEVLKVIQENMINY